MKRTNIICNTISYLVKRVLPILFVGFLVGCSNPNPKWVEGNPVIIDYHNSRVIHFEDFFDLNKAYFINFFSENNLVLSDMLEIHISEDYIFALDMINSQLYRFNLSGKLINKIGRPGNGPGEYSNPSFFSVDNSSRTIDIKCENGSAVKSFDFEGTFIERFSPPVIFSSFAKVSDDLYYYYTGYYSSNFHRLHLGDKKKIIESFLPLRTNAFDMLEQNFSNMGSYGFFRESFFPAIYQYNDSGIEKVFYFDFGKYEVKAEDLKKVVDPYDFFEKINMNGFCSTVRVHQGNKITCIITLLQKNMQPRLSHFYINKNDNSYTRVENKLDKRVTNDFFSSLRLIHIDKNDNVYYLVNPVHLKLYADKKPHMFQGLSLSDQNFNPVIIVVPLAK